MTAVFNGLNSTAGRIKKIVDNGFRKGKLAGVPTGFHKGPVVSTALAFPSINPITLTIPSHTPTHGTFC
jgi:hypothetical protein